MTAEYAAARADPVAMPVEDVTVEWDEAQSVPVTVATLVIPPHYMASVQKRGGTPAA